jgi:hypothetical protein
MRGGGLYQYMWFLPVSVKEEGGDQSRLLRRGRFGGWIARVVVAVGHSSLVLDRIPGGEVSRSGAVVAALEAAFCFCLFPIRRGISSRGVCLRDGSGAWEFGRRGLNSERGVAESRAGGCVGPGGFFYGRLGFCNVSWAAMLPKLTS